MARYSTGFVAQRHVQSDVILQPIFDVRPSATDYPRIVSLDFYFCNEPNNALNIAIGLSSSPGTLKTTAATLVPHGPNDPATSVIIGTDWFVDPGLPVSFFRRVTIPGITTVSFFLDLKAGISLGPTQTISCWGSLLASATGPLVTEVSIEVDV